jgi:hypothetical protein
MLGSVQHLVADSQYSEADSLLISFAKLSQDSTALSEATFWHALLMLTPDNDHGDPHEASQAFDSYIGSGATAHRTEALALRKTAQMLDSLTKARSLDSLPAVHLLVSDDSTKSTAREQEMAKNVKQLQDSLNKTTAELDRIKKRLSTGKP